MLLIGNDMSTSNPNPSAAKPWDDDLFERSNSANLLYSYLSADYNRKKILSGRARSASSNAWRLMGVALCQAAET